MKERIRQILREEYQGTIDYTPEQMENVLFEIYKDNLRGETPIYLKGIINIYTIGEKLNNDTNWSLLNFFDTNRILKEEIIKDLKRIQFDSVEEGLKILFSDKKKLDRYLNIVWNTVKKGLISENDFVNRLKSNNRVVNYTGEPGTKEDKFRGIDVKVGNVGIQVKPSNQVIIENGKHIVIVIGTKMPSYKSKSDVNYLAFHNEEDNIFYIFKNSNYTQEYNSDKKINTLVFDGKASKI
jgi:hypothetical protein